MALIPPWYRVAFDSVVLRRAILTGLGVGTVLAVAYHAEREMFERLGEVFEFERRGIVELKGKGPIETWFVVGRRRDAPRPVAAASRARR